MTLYPELADGGRFLGSLFRVIGQHANGRWLLRDEMTGDLYVGELEELPKGGAECE